VVGFGSAAGILVEWGMQATVSITADRREGGDVLIVRLPLTIIETA
jgi:hypothetical protein